METFTDFKETPHLCFAEFASIRGVIRIVIGNRYKYIRLKMATKNQTLILILFIYSTCSTSLVIYSIILN